MSLYKRPDSEAWWVNITHPQHPRIRQSTGTADRLEAQRIHDELKAELWSRPVLKGHTWGDAVLLWAKRPGRGEPDLLSMRKFATVYPDRPITEVTRENIHAALSFCRTAGTYTRYRNRIMAVLNIAKDEGWIREVPRLMTRTDKKRKPREWLTYEQWEALAAELPPHQRLMATFAIETGLRQANVLKLRWTQVDLERQLVWYEARDMKADRALAVPLSQGALNVLKAVQGQHKTFVFTYRGKPIKEIKTAFQAACIRAGVGRMGNDSPTTAGRYVGFTWHGLRHTWATWHIQNGTPLEVLQKLGGWADLRMVLVYAHHSPGHLASFANNTRRK